MNSELVGLPLSLVVVYPNRLFRVSTQPLLHATSIACRIALSTRLGVVLYLFAILGYSSLVTAESSSTLLITI